MKHLIYGLGGMGLVVVIIIIITTINGRMTRNEEMTSTLTTTLDQTVETLMQSGLYTIENKEEFISDIAQNILTTYENDANIEIQIMNADEKKGLLSIKVKEYYVNPNGNPGINECEKTVVFDKTDFLNIYTVYYYDTKGSVCSKYTVLENEDIPICENSMGVWYMKCLDGNYKECTVNELKSMVVTSKMSCENATIKFYASKP